MTGQPTIVFGAESLEGDSSGDWITRTLALEWQAGVGGQPPQPFVRVVDVLRPQPLDSSPDTPPTISPSVINSAGLMAQAGPITIAGQQIKAPLFEGVEVEVHKDREAGDDASGAWVSYQETGLPGLRIGTLSNAFSPKTSSPGNPIQKRGPNWILYDGDVFRIKVTRMGKKGAGKISAWISTKNPANPLGANWDDDETEIELEEQPTNSGNFYSPVQLLVADDVDDAEPCAAIYQGSSTAPISIDTDNQKNDPTHKIALGGWVYLKLPGMAVAGALVQVPVERVVRVEPVALRTPDGPVATLPEISDDLKKACERMATAGIKLEFPTRDGPGGTTIVDLLSPASNGENVSTDAVIDGASETQGVLTVPAEAQSLFTQLPPSKPNTMRVYFAAGVVASNGTAFAGFSTPRSLASGAYANRVVVNVSISPNKVRTPWTLTHELMHLLLNCAHDTGSVPNYGWPPIPLGQQAPVTIWLWSATVNTDNFQSTKRIRHESAPALNQRKALQTNSAVATKPN